MSTESNKSTLRSVDSISSVYAIVIGLALTKAIDTLVTKDANTGTNLDYSTIAQGIPAFVALLVTLVPFWHGMNRHLDRCYVTKTVSVSHQAILFDFFTFFLEATLLFVAGSSLRSGLVTFYCLGLLLAVDTVWGFISHLIHFRDQKPHIKKWAIINVVAGFLGYQVCVLPFQSKIWTLMFVAIMRTVVDYWICSDFYFPGSD